MLHNALGTRLPSDRGYVHIPRMHVTPGPVSELDEPECLEEVVARVQEHKSWVLPLAVLEYLESWMQCKERARVHQTEDRHGYEK